MAAAVRGDGGGIDSLAGELDRHGEAIEHDLVCAGWTLDDLPDRLSWRSLKAFVVGRAATPGTAINRVYVGDHHMWQLPEQLMAAAVDELRVANWQRAAAGAKKGNAPKRPKPIPRPGVDGYGQKPAGVPLSEARRIMMARNPAAFVREGDVDVG